MKTSAVSQVLQGCRGVERAACAELSCRLVQHEEVT